MTTATDDADLDAQPVELDRAHVFHSWSAQGPLEPMVVAGGLGLPGLGPRGQQLPRLLQPAGQRQHRPPAPARWSRRSRSRRRCSPRSARRRPTWPAARRPGGSPTGRRPGFGKVFFTNGGADANENAIRMARLVTGRDKVLSTYRSYHGNTGAAVVATGDWRRVPNEYARGHVHFFGPFLYRSEFWATTPEQEAERALHHLRRVVECEGPAGIAAILLETIPGTAGVLVPPPGYLAGVRALCDQHGIMLILDEVMAGFGRTGDWFAFDALRRGRAPT